MRNKSQRNIRSLRIFKTDCTLFLPADYDKDDRRYPVIYINGEIPLEEVLSELNRRLPGRSDEFLLLSMQPESWNDDFTPWSAPAIRRGEAAPLGRADAWISGLASEIKPYMDANYRTRPEPEHTALFGYSLGGLASLYALYRTDCFGAVGSLSGSLWYDGFCEYMERSALRQEDVFVYLSLGRKESQSRNPRMGSVAKCTERAQDILQKQLGEGRVYFEWNEGGHFHAVPERFAKAAAWWLEKRK